MDTKPLSPFLFAVFLLLPGVIASTPRLRAQEENEKTNDVLSHHPDRARVIREFLPNTGPASIAVALPASSPPRQAYCFDSDECRLRYAWSGGFINISYDKHDGPAKLEGLVYYRAEAGFPLRFGDPSNQPDEVDFLGYHLKNGRPVFRYRLNGILVHQQIRQRNEGRGLVQHFQLDNPSKTVYFVAKPKEGLQFQSRDGSFEDGQLTLSASEARSFSVTVSIKSKKKKQEKSK